MATKEKTGKQFAKRQTGKTEIKSEEVVSSDKKKKFFFSRKYAIVIAVLAIAGFAYYFKGIFIAATVNGNPISRFSVISDLEKQGGKQTLNSLITKQLILQEAKKKNISVSQEEIGSEIKRIEENLSKQGQDLNQLLTAQGMTKTSLEDQINLQKTVEKLLGKQIEVADKEIDDYIEKNKSSFEDIKDPNTIRENAKQILKEQKMSTKVQELLQNLQKNAKINYFVSY